jgi:uncharacterized protein YigE (DUF2233 family)
MKNIFILICCFLFGSIIYFSIRQNHQTKNVLPLSSVDATPGDLPQDIPLHTISFKNQSFAYEFVLTNPDTLTLIPNFTEKLTSTELAETNHCRFGINGGFYDTSNKPLGGFKTKNTVVKNPVKNRLIDGYIWKMKGRMYLTFAAPPEDAELYLQTGPVVRMGGERIPITIAEDELRRRNIFGIAKNGSILFLSIYSSESVYDGPFLGDLPAIIENIDQKESFHLVGAVNLDGGSASAFLSPSRRLQEFSPIGSFFCVQ